MSSTVIITFQLTKRKGTALLWSLHITGGSSEIRTRNQRIYCINLRLGSWFGELAWIPLANTVVCPTSDELP